MGRQEKERRRKKGKTNRKEEKGGEEEESSVIISECPPEKMKHYCSSTVSFALVAHCWLRSLRGRPATRWLQGHLVTRPLVTAKHWLEVKPKQGILLQ